MEEAILKYLREEATDMEKAQLVEWLRQQEANRQQFMQLRDLWLAATPIPHAGPDYAEQAFHRFTQATRELESKGSKKRFLRFTQVAAAVILGLVCLGGGYWLGNTPGEKTEDVLVTNHFIMGKESKGAITLPDGSVVWLHAESELTYPEQFPSSERKVQLKGEGYFEVKEDQKKPFRVETGELTVQVLGTRFNIKNYQSGNTTETTLLDGSVAIHTPAGNRQILLKPNEKFIWNKETHTGAVSQVTASDYILWTNDRLVMTNEPLADILFKLGRWYNIEIICEEDVPADTRLSLTVRRESKEEIFKLLELIAPVTCTITGRTVSIRNK